MKNSHLTLDDRKKLEKVLKKNYLKLKWLKDISTITKEIKTRKKLRLLTIQLLALNLNNVVFHPNIKNLDKIAAKISCYRYFVF